MAGLRQVGSSADELQLKTFQMDRSTTSSQEMDHDQCDANGDRELSKSEQKLQRDTGGERERARESEKDKTNGRVGQKTKNCCNK